MNATNLTPVTVVLVHAAWADASSWNRVIPLLLRQGIPVVAAQIPLTSLSDDVAAVRRVLRRISGPIVLVGHSYGGAVITAAGNDETKVTTLVYIAAMAPAEGETVGQLLHRAAPHASAPALVPDQDGFLWMSPKGFADAVAHDSSLEDAAVMAATQKPISIQCLTEPMTKPGWRKKPSWFLVAQRDRMIASETQRFMADRMGGRTVALEVDHTPIASAPQQVVSMIEEALDIAQHTDFPNPPRTGETR
jgi:pimeloyl-ACP methyl ester carboxylesterase